VNTVFGTEFPIRVDDTEVLSNHPIFTYDLLCLYRERWPDIDFCGVIGSDWLQPGQWHQHTPDGITAWTSRNHHWQPGDPEEQRLTVTGKKMLEEFDFYVIQRPGYEVPAGGLHQFGPRLSWLRMPAGTAFISANLQSEEVRKRTAMAARARRAASTGSLDLIVGLVPRAVLAYMLKSRLYDIPATPNREHRKRVAIFGGAFDPITNSHLTCAAQIVHSQCADEVWIVPSGPRPDKPKLKTSPLDRYCMCKMAVATEFTIDFPVLVSDIECFAPVAFYTYDLLCSLRTMHSEVQFMFVIGSDWLQPGSSMAKWTSLNPEWQEGDPEDQRLIVTGERMLQEFDFLVIHRPGYDVPPTEDDPTGLRQFGPRLSWMIMPEGTTFIKGNLSSTEIRKRTAVAARVRDKAQQQEWSGIDGLVPRGVLSYIRRQGLYSMNWR